MSKADIFTFFKVLLKLTDRPIDRYIHILLFEIPLNFVSNYVSIQAKPPHQTLFPHPGQKFFGFSVLSPQEQAGVKLCQAKTDLSWLPTSFCVANLPQLAVAL